MLLADNSRGFVPDIKKAYRESYPPMRRRGSGESTMLPSIDTSARSQPSPSPPMPSFVPKPFPPTSLAGVPTEYIIDQLHNLAPHYWDKPHTADCTIVIPVPHARGRPMQASPNPAFPPPPRPSYDPSGLGRRATEPALNFVPRISLKLHTDYLSAHSSFLRALFGGASPLDLINSTSSLHPTFNAPLRTSSGKFTIPANRLPRLLPCSPNHPVLYLPIPDPTSLHYLIHWMYFGKTSFIEEALNDGVIQWEGIARNVEYLGLSTDMKVFLGRWYGSWLNPERKPYSRSSSSSSSEEDSDTEYSDEDEDDYRDDFSSASDVEDDIAEEPKTVIEDEREERGRTRVTRCLSWTSQYAHEHDHHTLDVDVDLPSIS